MIGDIDTQWATSAAQELTRECGSEVRAEALDVSDPGSVSAVAEAAIAAFGGLEVWVNNAGVYPSTPLLKMTEADWDRVLNTNLRGTFLGCREAARRMIEAGRGGVIVNLASIAGLRGRQAGVSHYVASKHGIVGLTKQLALELAPEGIRVLAVAPTTIVTPGVESALAGRAADQGVEVDGLLAGTMGRAGRPDDVARVVLFCASDLSMFMTGSTLLVDGGEMAR
jgi:NAD(P)-dependent dehydrogenase (short-subunit alcohol dehydrogenase family)